MTVSSRLVVLQSFGPPDRTTNPYVTQLIAAVGARADVRLFSWRTALAGRYDVFHVHWPERLVRGRTRAGTAIRLALFATLLGVLAARRRPIVRTLHNQRPHEPGHRIEAFLLTLCDRRTRVWIALNDITVPPQPGPVVVVPHGHYRAWAAGLHRTVPDAIRGRVLFFGLLRRYKGVERLVEAFAETTDTDASLHVVGRAVDPATADAVRAAAATDRRITGRLEHLEDAELVDEIGRAQVVALPYRELHNSGAALLALSLDRPVLVPGNPVTDALAEEVGEEWVRRFAEPLDGSVLAAALKEPRPAGSPDLGRREWDDAADRHLAAYERARRGR